MTGGVLKKVFLLMLVALAFAAPAEAKEKNIRVALFGDNLCSGYALKWNEGLKYVLEKKLKVYRPDVEVANSSRYGSTSEDGKKWLAYYMANQKPDIVVIALGYNDMLRGVNPKDMYENLEYIIQQLQSRKVPVILVGFKAPLDKVSRAYAEKFNGVFPALAEHYRLTLIPNLLEGVDGKSDLTIADGVNPNTKGVEVIADTLLPYIYAEIVKPK